MSAYVGVYSSGGGFVGGAVPLRATTDGEGRFRVERAPVLGTFLRFGGDGWIDVDVPLDEVADVQAIEQAVLRSCHVRIECTGVAWADAEYSFLDAADKLQMIVSRRASSSMSHVHGRLHAGKTPVVGVSEAAVTLVLKTSGDKRELRLPIALRPGEVTTIVDHSR